MKIRPLSILILIIILIFVILMAWAIRKDNQAREICVEAQQKLSDLQVRYIIDLAEKVENGTIEKDILDNVKKEFLQQAKDLQEDCLGK